MPVLPNDMPIDAGADTEVQTEAMPVLPNYMPIDAGVDGDMDFYGRYHYCIAEPSREAECG
jgi:hypothetical protein